MQIYKLIFSMMILIYVVSSCSSGDARVEGKIEITYNFNAPDSIEPSFQTVIWLENEKGEYEKTFLVTEFLSMGGYEDTFICSKWNSTVEWEEVSDAEYDAVTQATPPIGNNKIKIDSLNEKFNPGKYKINIQTHILGDYNILYQGDIILGKTLSIGNIERVYIPEALEGAENVLDSVSIKYVK